MKSRSKYYVVVLLSLLTTSLIAQSVNVFYDKSEDLAYYVHEVKAKETLYGISKTYGCPSNDIRMANKLSSNALHINQELIIPFNNENILYQKPSNRDFVEVHYQVKKKETAFRICRKYFEINLTAIKELNRLKRNVLDIDQSLLLGYITRYSPESGEDLRDIEVTEELAELELEQFEDELDTDLDIESTSNIPTDDQLYSINYDNGAAFWNKESAGLNGYFVLHRFAERNTWIEVTNPMYGISVRAKVIGNIPSTGYPNDVLVVVSPSIAKDLGALDARFYVKVRYLRAESKLTKGK